MAGISRRWIAVTVCAAGLLTLCLMLAGKLVTTPPPLPDVLPPASSIGMFRDLPAPPPPPPPPSIPGRESRIGLRPFYGETSYTARAGVTPQRTREVRPVYPPIAISYDLRGNVILEATINEQGRVVDARVVRSIPVLDQATIDAVRQWEFRPTYVNGSPAPVVISVTATFDPSNAPAAR